MVSPMSPVALVELEVRAFCRSSAAAAAASVSLAKPETLRWAPGERAGRE